LPEAGRSPEISGQLRADGSGEGAEILAAEDVLGGGRSQDLTVSEF